MPLRRRPTRYNGHRKLGAEGTMKISLAKAHQMFTVMEFKGMEQWSMSEYQRRLDSIMAGAFERPEMYEMVNDDPEAQATLKEILAAVDAKESITVVERERDAHPETPHQTPDEHDTDTELTAVDAVGETEEPRDAAAEMEAAESEQETMTATLVKKKGRPAGSKNKTKAAPAKVSTKEKTKKAAAGVGKDKFGSRLGSKAALWNAALTKKPQTMAEILTKIGSDKTMYNHANRLVEEDLIKRVDDGYCLK